MRRIILCPNPYRDRDLSAAREAADILAAAGLETVYCLPFRMEPQEGRYPVEVRSLQQEVRCADMIVTFGGDGTILHLAKTAATKSLPVLGVNLGSLGFMSELERNEMQLLANLATGQYKTEKRMMLDVEVERDGRSVYHNMALNDAVVTKGAVARVVRLNVEVSSCRLGSFAGDGVIVATPTGSTGYSLSAGGPIVEPTAQNFVVSPICAHSMGARAYVLSAENVVTINPRDAGRKPLYLAVDGGKAFPLRETDVIRIRRSRYVTELIRLTDKSTFDILRTKLTGDVSYEK